MVGRWIRHITAGSKGLWRFMQEDYGYDFVILLAIAMLLAWLFGASRIGLTIVGLLGVLTLSVEAFNSAIERICNLVQPQSDPKIKSIKDISAGGVLAIGFVFVLTTICVCYWRL